MNLLKAILGGGAIASISSLPSLITVSSKSEYLLEGEDAKQLDYRNWLGTKWGLCWLNGDEGVNGNRKGLKVGWRFATEDECNSIRSGDKKAKGNGRWITIYDEADFVGGNECTIEKAKEAWRKSFQTNKNASKPWDNFYYQGIKGSREKNALKKIENQLEFENDEVERKRLKG